MNEAQSHSAYAPVILIFSIVGRNFGVGSSWKYRRSVTSKANTIEAAYKEILNETREAEEITNSFPSHSPVETVDAEPNYELRNAQIVADYFSIEHQSRYFKSGSEYTRSNSLTIHRQT